MRSWRDSTWRKSLWLCTLCTPWASSIEVSEPLFVEQIISARIAFSDVKPENILLDRFGHLKLGDFGSAVALNEDGSFVSLAPVGTPDYIAPELLSILSTTGNQKQQKLDVSSRVCHLPSLY